MFLAEVQHETLAGNDAKLYMADLARAWGLKIYMAPPGEKHPRKKWLSPFGGPSPAPGMGIWEDFEEWDGRDGWPLLICIPRWMGVADADGIDGIMALEIRDLPEHLITLSARGTQKHYFTTSMRVEKVIRGLPELDILTNPGDKIMWCKIWDEGYQVIPGPIPEMPVSLTGLKPGRERISRQPSGKLAIEGLTGWRHDDLKWYAAGMADDPRISNEELRLRLHAHNAEYEVPQDDWEVDDLADYYTRDRDVPGAAPRLGDLSIVGKSEGCSLFPTISTSIESSPAPPVASPGWDLEDCLADPLPRDAADVLRKFSKEADQSDPDSRDWARAVPGDLETYKEGLDIWGSGGNTPIAELPAQVTRKVPVYLPRDQASGKFPEMAGWVALARPGPEVPDGMAVFLDDRRLRFGELTDTPVGRRLGAARAEALVLRAMEEEDGAPCTSKAILQRAHRDDIRRELGLEKYAGITPSNLSKILWKLCRRGQIVQASGSGHFRYKYADRWRLARWQLQPVWVAEQMAKDPEYYQSFTDNEMRSEP